MFNAKKKIIIFLLLILLLILFSITKNNNEKFIYEKDIYNDKKIYKIPVFCFHRLVPDDIKKKLFQNNEWVGSIKIFQEMIQYLYEKGYKTLSIEEFYKWIIGEVDYKAKSILITIDDGHYEDYYLAYPLIKKYNFKATSFIIGSRIKNKTAPYNKYVDSYIGLDSMNKIRKHYPNFEFQSHSFNMHFLTINHFNKTICRICNMTNKELKDDILRNKKYGFTAMAYPYGCFTEEIQKILKNNGYLISFKFGPYNFATRNSNRFAIPRIKINGNATLVTLKKWLKAIE